MHFLYLNKETKTKKQKQTKNQKQKQKQNKKKATYPTNQPSYLKSALSITIKLAF